MPTKPWPIWLLATLLILGLPAIGWIYWPLVLRSGVLPPEGDSVIIPMVESIFAAVIAGPVVFLVTWLCTRRYNSAARLFAWRIERPLRSSAATVLLGGPAAALLMLSLLDLRLGDPWYEYLWTAYELAAVAWLLLLRAAAVEQRKQ